MKPALFLHRLISDPRGNGVVELALLAPIVATLFMGMIDTSMGIGRKLALEQAAQRAVERATTYGNAGADYSDLAADAAAAAGVDAGAVTVDSWLECDGVRQADFSGVCASGAQIARFVGVSITDSYTPMFAYGPLGRSLGAGADGAFTLDVVASVRIQ